MQGPGTSSVAAGHCSSVHSSVVRFPAPSPTVQGSQLWALLTLPSQSLLPVPYQVSFQPFNIFTHRVPGVCPLSRASMYPSLGEHTGCQAPHSTWIFMCPGGHPWPRMGMKECKCTSSPALMQAPPVGPQYSSAVLSQNLLWDLAWL